MIREPDWQKIADHAAKCAAHRTVEALSSEIETFLAECMQIDRMCVLQWDAETSQFETAFAQARAESDMPEISVAEAVRLTRHGQDGLLLEAKDASGTTLSGYFNNSGTTGTVLAMSIDSEQDPLALLFAETTDVADAEELKRLRQSFTFMRALYNAQFETCLYLARATHDPLTGLPNNSYFVQRVSRALSDDGVGGVLLLDMDAFKRVNVAAGAEVGDRTLLDVAHTIRDVAKADGIVARYGSDKFAVLLEPDTSSIAVRLHDVAERVRAAIGTKVVHGVKLSISIGGLAFDPVKQQDATDVIARADDLLGKARARGGGEIEISEVDAS